MVNSAIMKFGKMLMNCKGVTTVGKGSIFAWAADGDIAIMGEAPEDFNGRVCFVKVPGEERPAVSRLYADGENILLGYMDNFDVWKSYPVADVTILHEVLAIVHLYGPQDRPKAADAWEKRAKKAIKGAADKFS